MAKTPESSFELCLRVWRGVGERERHAMIALAEAELARLGGTFGSDETDRFIFDLMRVCENPEVRL